MNMPEHNLSYLDEKIEKLNRRAQRLGTTPLSVNILRCYVEERCSSIGVKYNQRMVEIEIVGDYPKLNGWHLLAVLERLDNGEVLIRNVPGHTVPSQYRDSDFTCSHCHTDRRRKEVFVVGKVDGITMQVGRQCLADFLGGSVESLVARAEWLFDVNDAVNDCCGHKPICNMMEFLTTAAIVIRRLGWVSNKTAQEQFTSSTSNLTWMIVTDKGRELIEDNNIVAEPRDYELASEALSWAVSLEGRNDYEYNLGVACRQIYVTPRTAGLVASAIAAYKRTKELPQQTGKHIGEIGQRLNLQATVKHIRYFDSEYGVRTLITFMFDNSTLIWWASKKQDVEEGDVVDFRGTVKAHNMYNGTPQTVFTRVTLKKL
jgi:hypothetical protein